MLQIILLFISLKWQLDHCKHLGIQSCISLKESRNIFLGLWTKIFPFLPVILLLCILSLFNYALWFRAVAQFKQNQLLWASWVFRATLKQPENTAPRCTSKATRCQSETANNHMGNITARSSGMYYYVFLLHEASDCMGKLRHSPQGVKLNLI